MEKLVEEDGWEEDQNVRATVKNPVDHPMGGGEAKSSGGHPEIRMVCLLKDSKQEIKIKLLVSI